jgi:glutathione S-transferase
MTVLVAVTLLVVVAWYGWERSHRRTRPMAGGMHEDITLPHESEWELYHNALSLCSKKTRVCLAELGIEYKGHHIDLIETGSYENISRHFLAVNPAGLVPVLVHNGHPVYESHDQITYAAEHAPRPQLIPADAGERERMRKWVDKASLFGDDPTQDLETSAGNCIPGLTVPLFSAMVQDIPYARILEGLLFHRIKLRPLLFLLMKLRGVDGIAGAARARLIVGRSRKGMHRHLDDLEAQLQSSGGPWILGAFFSLADVSWMVIFERLREAEWENVFLTEGRTRTKKYWEALQARPSYRQGILAFGHATIDRGKERLLEKKKTSAGLRALYAD